MKIAVASDERTHLTDVVVDMLKERGHEPELFGPLKGEDVPWPIVSQRLAESVVSGENQEGVLFCWTGTGAAIAANKVPGVRAALVRDAETARGARWWNDANVLVMSLRATSEVIAKEILDAWFSERFLPEEKECIEQLRRIEQKYSRV
ncbi:MAG: RpiB/LacA/LacB family sugar-phosphate isomerase [Desulfobacterales bacterium]|nr:RpiB/LacA/LacB family sugar-phosphate isomerase [Desulfobacterales bacterium]